MDAEQTTKALHYKAAALMHFGRFDEAEPTFQAILEQISIEPSKPRAQVFDDLFFLHFVRGNLELARDANTQAQVLYQAIGDMAGIGVTETRAGTLEMHAGHRFEAISLFESALVHLRAVNQV